MKNFLFTTFTCICLMSWANINSEILSSHDKKIVFHENKGQIHDQNYNATPEVLFSGKKNGLTFHLKQNGISYQITKVNSWQQPNTKRRKLLIQIPESTTIQRLDIKWLNTNKACEVETGASNPDYDRYYIGNNSEGFIVHNFNDVYYKNIYPGITLHYYSHNNELKYDYIVKAGSDPKNIKLGIFGAESIHLNANGSLVIKTPLGNIEEAAPIVFQNNKKLTSKWVINGNTLCFDIPDYDPNYEMVIDPLTRLWGTYNGGSSNESTASYLESINSDVYLCGQSSSISNISTTGAFQVTFGGGYSDAFLMKFNANGNKVWGTYIGGTDNEFASDISENSLGEIIITGSTSSSITAIPSPSCHQSTFGGVEDVFLMKFNSSGAKIWGTYYGGFETDYPNACAIDTVGNIYIAGETQTYSTTAIATPGSHQPTTIGTHVAFLAKFNSSGVRQWGTYYGITDDDYGYDCAVDAQNNVLLTGQAETTVAAVISTPGSYQPNIGGFASAFVAKFDPSGQRLWGTYFGDENSINSCISDANSNLYLAGEVYSGSTVNITTTGCHQSNLGGGFNDGFLAKLNASGTQLIWGTYYGGAGTEYLKCTKDTQDNVYLIGSSGSTSSISTNQSYQPSLSGTSDVVLVKFNPNGVRLWGTYFGGAGEEYLWNSGVIKPPFIYLCGSTTTGGGTIIATPSSYQSTLGGQSDIFIEKFYDCTPLNPSNLTSSFVCQAQTVNISATSSTASVNWYSGSTSTVSIGTGTSLALSNLSLGTYTYYAEASSSSCSLTSQRVPIHFTLVPSPTVSAVTSETNALCAGNTATLTATGANNYTWNPGGNGTAIVISPTVTTVYTVTGTNTFGCASSHTLLQTVSPCTSVNEQNKTTKHSPIIYPNPSLNGVFTIENSEPCRVKIFDNLGKIVYKTSLIALKDSLDISGFAKGTYTILIETDTQILATSLIYQ